MIKFLHPVIECGLYINLTGHDFLADVAFVVSNLAFFYDIVEETKEELSLWDVYFRADGRD